MIEYERFGPRQCVRIDGRIVGYVEQVNAHRWRAFSGRYEPVGEAPRRRDAARLLVPDYIPEEPVWDQV